MARLLSRQSVRCRAMISPDSNVNQRRIWTGAALIAGFALIAYLPSLGGGFIFDDDVLLTDSKLIKSSDGLYRFWCTTEAPDYWPLSSSTLWLEWRMWGMHASGYRVTNLLLHIATALVLWAVLSQLRIPGAFLAACVFA